MAQGKIRIETPVNSRVGTVTDMDTNEEIPVMDSHLHDGVSHGQDIHFDIEHRDGRPFAVNLRPRSTEAED